MDVGRVLGARAARGCWVLRPNGFTCTSIVTISLYDRFGLI